MGRAAAAQRSEFDSGFKATEASLTIAADQSDSMPVLPSSSCSGIHNRLHGSLHRLVVDRIDVGEFVRDRARTASARPVAAAPQRGGLTPIACRLNARVETCS